jgi:hypothetical protein
MMMMMMMMMMILGSFGFSLRKEIESKSEIEKKWKK